MINEKNNDKKNKTFKDVLAELLLTTTVYNYYSRRRTFSYALKFTITGNYSGVVLK